MASLQLSLLIVPLLMVSSLLHQSSSQYISFRGVEAQGENFLNSPQVSSCPVPDPALYYRPVIGILSHPGDGASGRLKNGSGVTNIPSSYVKFVESAGARVIPLIHTEPWENIQEKLSLVNGVLFTGGWAKEGLYFEIAEKIFQIVLDKNDAGEQFPLFAICLGFEILSIIVSKSRKTWRVLLVSTSLTTQPKDHDICEKFSAEDHASTLQFTNIADIQGSLFQRFPPELLRKLSTECLAMQNHQFGLSPKRLQENDLLSSFFKILTTTVDENNQVYVSTVKAHKYPVTGFQWHPEKNAFEWGSKKIPHSEDAIQVTQYVANYFISEARKSSNRPAEQKVLDNLIYNYSPTYCGKAGKGYDEVYIFA